MAGGWVEGMKFVLCEPQSDDIQKVPVLCTREEGKIGLCGNGESPYLKICPAAEKYLLTLTAIRQRRGVFQVYLHKGGTGAAVQEPEGSYHGVSGGRTFGGIGNVIDSEEE